MTEPIWSTGGVGGERAVTEDLEWAAGVLRAVADDVGFAHLELARRSAALELDGGAEHPALAAQVRHAANLAPALEAELDETSRRLTTVADAFLDAERAARHQVGFVGEVRQRAQDTVGAVAWLARVAGAASIVVTPVGGLLSATGHRGVIGDVLPDGPPPTTSVLDRDAAEFVSKNPTVIAIEAALTLVAWIIEHLACEPWQGELTATRIDAHGSGSLQDVMGVLYDSEQQGDGSLRISRWTDAAGVTRRVVYIPGTTDWLLGDGNPFDAEADGQLRFGRLPDAARVVMAALAADGAGPGDPVMLTGHSLGGTVATGLAANADFRKNFTVRSIVTAGSPTGVFGLPSTVNALHLEGTRDIVPGLDGKRNEETPTRITVHHDARDSELAALAGAGEDIGSAHHLDTYGQTARLVDEGLSPSTDAWLTSERAFFEPGADVVVTEYKP